MTGGTLEAKSGAPLGATCSTVGALAAFFARRGFLAVLPGLFALAVLPGLFALAVLPREAGFLAFLERAAVLAVDRFLAAGRFLAVFFAFLVFFAFAIFTLLEST